MNAAELNTQLIDAAEALRLSLADLELRTQNYAKAERAYRLAKATAYLSTTGTVAEREAHAEGAINELRYERDLSEGPARRRNTSSCGRSPRTGASGSCTRRATPRRSR